eukprot:862931_1
MPQKISVSGVVDKKYNIDTIIGATLVYNDRQYAQISCNFIANSFQERLITGMKGRIRIEAPSHAPTKITVYINAPPPARGISEIKTFEFSIPGAYDTIFPNSQGMIYQIEEVIKCLDEGRKESPNYTIAEMVTTMKIMDEMR